MPQAAYDLTRTYTVDEVLAFPPDEYRYELVDGELLVSGAPRVIHQHVLAKLNHLVREYLDQFGLWHTACFSPADITWGPRTLVQPDLFVVHPGDFSPDWNTFKRLRLVIEVISPSTAGHDRIKKLRAYQKNGVEHYWIVDPYQKTIDVWTPVSEAPVTYTDIITWQHALDTTPLVIEIPSLWEMP